jgi:XTP/dITP diphosphohydrolase
MKTIYFVTGNKGKFLEVKEKMVAQGFEIVQRNIGYPEIQATNLEDVALFGAEYIEEKISHPFILEDAGLFIDALEGFPGVYSSYVYHTIGLKGILKLLDGEVGDRRKAVFKSVIAYKEPDKKSRLFIGKCHGMIANQEVGSHGFGYDPIFVPDRDTRTFGQMEVSEKNCFSHRGKSIEKLLDFFKK